MSLDVTKLRADFPILERTVNGKPLIYLDNADSSQTRKQVVESIVTYYYKQHANVHRGAQN